MQQNLYYLSGFNNYYNRKIINPNERLLSAFEQWVRLSVRDSSFNPNDGVDTQVVVNYSGISDNVEFDYLLVSTDNITIDSKWFIIDRSRNLSGQWTLSLRRDLISDYFDSILNSTAFIEKANLDIGNKLIFNKENGINYNQVKVGEALLKDETKTPWIVGYFSNNTPETKVGVVRTRNYFSPAPISLDNLKELVNSFFVNEYFFNWYGSKLVASYDTDLWSFVFNSKGDLTSEHTVPPPIDEQRLVFTSDYNSTKSSLRQTIKGSISSLIASADSELSSKYSQKLISRDTYEIIKSMEGNVFKDTDNNIFSVRISPLNVTDEHLILENTSGSIYTVMTNIFTNSNIGTVRNITSYTIPSGLNLDVNISSFTITIEESSQFLGTTFTLPTTTQSLTDAPYKIFAIPYYSLLIDPDITFYTSSSLSMDVALSLCTALGGSAQNSFLYDVQLLPYFPLRYSLNSGIIDLAYLTNNVDYIKVTAENNSKDEQEATVIFFPNESSFQFSINAPNNANLRVPDNSIDFKIANETQFCRLCSPNYSGAFEFKPTMNYGVSYFEINCTYKPYQPYIHVNPFFSGLGLYGGDYNDQRGLVCSGDFSIPIINDAWIQYQISNKSYEDSLKRSIENMDVTYNINRKKSQTAGIINAITAGVGGTVSGAVSGSMLGGGPIAGVLGGVTGLAAGALSAYGLSKDLEYADALHREALSFAQDNFGYQLQNVQALPYGLGKVSALSINNKLFPFLEFYSATEIEKTALRNKLIYNGMTVMSVEKIREYVIYDGSFLQCQLIRYNPIESEDDPNVEQFNSLDYHTTAEIASELHKGVYI